MGVRVSRPRSGARGGLGVDPAEYYRGFEGLSHWWRRETKNLVAEIVRRTVPPGGRVLDAGCGIGDLARLLERQYRVRGLDSSDRAVSLARVHGLAALVRGDVQQLPFRPATFDAVVSLDVLCHESIKDEGRALWEFGRVLVPGGRVIVNLPAYDWMRSVHDDLVGNARRYTAGRVCRLFESAGLSVEKVTYRNTLLFPFAVFRRLPKLQRAPSLSMPGWLDRALGFVLSLETYWLRRARFPLGVSVLALGRTRPAQ